MARSVKKGIFVDPKLMKKVEDLNKKNQKKVIQTYYKLCFYRKLVGGESQRFLCQRFAHAADLKHHTARFHYRDPELRHAFSFSHSRLSRFFRHGFVRENPDPNSSITLHLPGERDTGRFDLAGSNPAWLEGLKSEITESDRAPTLRLSAHPSALCLPVFDSLRH